MLPTWSPKQDMDKDNTNTHAYIKAGNLKGPQPDRELQTVRECWEHWEKEPSLGGELPEHNDAKWLALKS